jgi:RNA polymerase sigma-70 factor (ECF subfamily)
MPSLKSLDDNELAVLVAQGNRDAFMVLYDRHSGIVYGLALKMMGEEMSAEEIAQEAFIKLWTRASSFSPGRGNLLPWLLTITRRVALDRIRLENRRPDFSNPFDPEDVWRVTANPDSQTDEARWHSMHFALHELPDEQRQVIELSYYHGMSHSQIEEYLDIPLGTVKTRIRLGMDKLRQIWTADKSKTGKTGV